VKKPWVACWSPNQRQIRRSRGVSSCNLANQHEEILNSSADWAIGPNLDWAKMHTQVGMRTFLLTRNCALPNCVCANYLIFNHILQSPLANNQQCNRMSDAKNSPDLTFVHSIAATTTVLWAKGVKLFWKILPWILCFKGKKLGTLQRDIYTSIYHLYMDYIMACFGAIWVSIWGTTTKLSCRVLAKSISRSPGKEVTVFQAKKHRTEKHESNI